MCRRCLYVPQKPFVNFLGKVIQGEIGPAEDLMSIGKKVCPSQIIFCPCCSTLACVLEVMHATISRHMDLHIPVAKRVMAGNIVAAGALCRTS